MSEGVRAKPRVFIKTFGCQMNEYDSDKMADVLAQSEGLEQTADPEQADVILFNTCSVREKAQERVFHDLGRVRELKAAKPDVLILASHIPDGIAFRQAMLSRSSLVGTWLRMSPRRSTCWRQPSGRSCSLATA